MINLTRGNLLEAEAEALVNTVNTVGVMGKGIALQFKKAFPDNFKAYKTACDNGEVVQGSMFVFDRQTMIGPRYIINFPTKRHWKGNSRPEDIEAGLVSLVKQVKELNIQSIAVPPLGCGLGGLPWTKVQKMIENAFASLSNVNVMLYEPAGAPAPKNMVNRTSRPPMTEGRAALVGLIKRYLTPEYESRLSLLEIQKLAYFLQEAGQPLKLKFEKAQFGPYADSLRHVLNIMEGHFTEGFGDGNNKPDTPMCLKPGAAQEAEKVLSDHPLIKTRYQRVAEVIEGFELPYGMELLATVHWVSKENPSAASDVDIAIAEVQAWNSRKRIKMKPGHVKAAWNQLHSLGWLNAS